MAASADEEGLQAACTVLGQVPSTNFWELTRRLQPHRRGPAHRLQSALERVQVTDAYSPCLQMARRHSSCLPAGCQRHVVVRP